MINRYKARKIVFLALSILWMAVIFYYSSKNADLSTQDSYRVGMYIGHLFYPGFDKLDMSFKLEFAELLDHPVRKAAHASEYAVLALLLFWGTLSRKFEIKKLSDIIKNKAVKISWLLTTLYACTDEIHQLFVPGRAGMITDVMIDSAGAAIGLLAFGLFFLLYIVLRRLIGLSVE